MTGDKYTYMNKKKDGGVFLTYLDFKKQSLK